jgi:hypothetical protein
MAPVAAYGFPRGDLGVNTKIGTPPETAPAELIAQVLRPRMHGQAQGENA